ncbi:hypothetical protein EZS27_025108 [termite gut metagenome]|uniref:GLUG domain-containing protein n=1 Tax=termite gut metagenome TaxID=433724 RepID=A0A5J4QWR7_9ZZZZ
MLAVVTVIVLVSPAAIKLIFLSASAIVKEGRSDDEPAAASETGETGPFNFSITGYEGQIITVTFDGNATEDVTLSANGNGKLTNSQTPRTIKSIKLKATGGKDILIGRKEDSGNIILSVDNSTHAVKWRTKTDNNATALIGTAAELLLKFNAPTAVTTYEFEADIDLMDQQWEPVATLSKNIDGKGHKIYNLNMTLDFGGATTSGSAYGGLFRKYSGTLSNLHIASGTISSTGISAVNAGGVAAFTGLLESSGQIIGCSNTAKVTGNMNVAGICARVGNTNSKIIACANYGKITATDSSGAGGICYYFNSGSITACYNTGEISASYVGSHRYAGGIAARFSDNTTISASYNTGTIIPTGDSPEKETGAINGSNSGDNTIAESYYSASSSTYGAGATSTTTTGTAKEFSSANWPESTDSNWGTGDGTNGNYWKNIGSWNAGTPTYPTLYWE